MRSKFIKASEIHTFEITEADLEDLAGFNIRVYGREDTVRFLDGLSPDDLENWRANHKHLHELGYILFGLRVGGKIVGTSALILKEDKAVFTGMIIDPDYRGMGLADQFYELSIRYLQSIKFIKGIELSVLPTNDASIRAAKRNGFVASERYDGPHQVFVRALE